MGSSSVNGTLLAIWTLLMMVTLLFSLTEAVMPEIAQPIKNITIEEGCYVELTCQVRNLGSHRIIWLKSRVGEKETLIGVNSLKVVLDKRLKMTLLQASDEITMSTISIHGTTQNDSATYECALSTSPVIRQIGRLEVIPKSEQTILHGRKPIGVKRFHGTSQIPVTNNESQTSKNRSGLFWENSNQESQGKNDTVVCMRGESCNSLWTEITNSVKKFIKTITTDFLLYIARVLLLITSND